MHKRDIYAWVTVAMTLVLVVTASVALALAVMRPTIVVRFGDQAFRVWVADTAQRRTQGLSGVKQLPQDGGMLFMYDKSGHPTIVMRDMHIPLDIIWLDEQQRVVHVVKRAQPDVPPHRPYRSPVPARYVLELPAGVGDEYGITPGDTAVIDQPRRLW